jgi:TolB protein
MLVTQQVEAVSDIWRGPLADISDAKKMGAGGRGGLSFVTDGRILYSAMLSAQTEEILLMNADGTDRRQLTSDNSSDLTPVASPDGRYIVFTSNRSGNFEVWRMGMDGTNLLRLTDSAGATGPNISPDGKWVTYLSSTDGKIRRVPLEGGESVELIAGAIGASTVSPDGKLIAYCASVNGAWGIAISSFEDGSLVRKFDLGSQSLNNRVLKWTPDGKALLYSATSGAASNIWMQPLGGGPPTPMTNFKADGIFSFDVSGDGKDFICARGGWKQDIVLIKNFR